MKFVEINKVKFAKMLAVYFICTLFVTLGLFSQTPRVYASTINAPTDYLSLNAGLVGWWTFDGNTISGTSANDMSGNGNTGTLVNSPSPTIGKVGQALTFNGVNTAVSVDSVSSQIQTGSVTFSAWIKSPVSTQSGVIFVRLGDPPSDNDINLAWGNTSGSGCTGVCMNVYTGSGFQDAIGPSTLTPNTWYHFVGTFSTTNGLVLYENGVSVATNSNTSRGSTYSTHAHIGSNLASGSSYFSGSIDDVRIYNRALSAGEVAQLYNSTAGSHTNVSQVGPNNLSQGLVGWWTFDGNALTSATATDMSGNGNDGSLVNSPTPTVGQVGQALTFDGLTNYVSLPSSILSDANLPNSVCMWLKNNDTTYIQGGNYSQTAINLNFPNGYLRVANDENHPPSGNLAVAYSATTAWSNETTNSVLVNGKWLDFCYTFDGSSLVKIYINGQLVSSAGGLFNGFSNGGVNNIGARNPGNGTWKGSIDDVRIYNRALSAGEVAQLYNSTAGSHVNTSPVGTNNLSQGLVGWWTFDGKTITGATTTDVSGNGDDGAMINTPKTIIGKFGQALTFNGTNQYIDVGIKSALNLTTTGTISSWFKVDSANSGRDAYVAGNADAFNDRGGYVLLFCGFSCSPGAMYFETTNNVGVWSDTLASGNYADGKWHLATGVWDGSNVNLYIDGSLASGPYTQVTPVSNVYNFKIGYGPSGTNPYFKGGIDDVRVYNRALSASEIKQLYTAGIQ